MGISKKWKLSVSFFTAAVLLTLSPISSFAQESDGGVNSGSFGLVIQGDAGFGRTAFGMVDGSSSSSFGGGPGSGIGLSGMLNFSIFALKLHYTYSTFDTMEWSQEGIDFKTEGDGYYSTLDALVGLKLFTEQGDMGYTHLYGGLRYWRAVRNVDKTYVAGIDTGLSSETDMKGEGWIIGYQDLSTFPIGVISLAFQSAVWFDYAPVKTVNGGDLSGEDKVGMGFGLNAGIGVAFEDLGILVLAGYKFDVTATTFKSGGDEWVAGAGHGLGYISAAIEF